jgi:hypothetical protein
MIIKKPKNYIKDGDIVCNHCGFPINYRNLSGYCDHLNYPNCCSICKNTPIEKQTYTYKKPPDFIEEQEMEV